MIAVAVLTQVHFVVDHTAANISRVEYLTLIFLKVHSAQ